MYQRNNLLINILKYKYLYKSYKPCYTSLHHILTYSTSNNILNNNNNNNNNKINENNNLNENNNNEKNNYLVLKDDENIYKNELINAKKEVEENIIIVDNISLARDINNLLLELPLSVIHACDTEVIDLDIKLRSPVGNGKVICASIYSGRDIDIGFGKGKTLWIENLDESEGVLNEFKPFFEGKRYRKVWHNYGFDRHVLSNENINCDGFAGDTMHMARLYDTSRERIEAGQGYSLESLTNDLLNSRKRPMKELFGKRKIKKDGTLGNIIELPKLDHIQKDKELRNLWIMYSCLDAKKTWELYKVLELKLKNMKWLDNNNLNMMNFYDFYLAPFGEILTDLEKIGFCIDINNYLPIVKKNALNDQKKNLEIFRKWCIKNFKNGDLINPGSSAQIQTLFFGGSENSKTKEILPRKRTFQTEKDEWELKKEEELLKKEEGKFWSLNVNELKIECEKRKIKKGGKRGELIRRLIIYDEDQTPYNILTNQQIYDIHKKNNLKILKKNIKKKDIKNIDLNIYNDNIMISRDEMIINIKNDRLKKMEPFRPLPKQITKTQNNKKDFIIESIGMKPISYTISGWPAVTSPVLKELAGDLDTNPPKYGIAYDFFNNNYYNKNENSGLEACKAIYALAEMSSIDTILSTFVLPLVDLVDKNNRIHCSLNLNTETGRLSSRRPNLQNQPALEKDYYKIRKLYTAEKNNSLIVADYGQLELRLLAHMTNCKSMIDAFEKGGCFHSRTAVGMFPYVRDAVDSGDVLLEWDYSKGKKPTKPLVKEKFGAERRKAKVLNFSIAYGKTAHGLSLDWGVTPSEAKLMLDAWYEDRPEVKLWQENIIEETKKNGYTRTLMGRYRNLPDILSPSRVKRGHATRAAINTPIQGGAADVVMMAMIKIWRNELLKKLGWKMILQIHDEIILEGPEESQDEALNEVIFCMNQPFDNLGLSPLLVDLEVDAKYGKTWYDSK